jgi:hypothetical protein
MRLRFRGIMLLEVGAAISATAVLLYGAVFLFSSFQRIDRTARLRLQMSRELTRLAEQFRDDVNAAREVEEPGDTTAAGNKLLIRLFGDANERVEYSVSENGQLSRALMNAEKIVERDAFAFGPQTTFSIDVGRDGASLVTLVITKSPDANGDARSPTTQRRIAAGLSRDRRYAVELTAKDPR